MFLSSQAYTLRITTPSLIISITYLCKLQESWSHGGIREESSCTSWELQKDEDYSREDAGKHLHRWGRRKVKFWPTSGTDILKERRHQQYIQHTRYRKQSIIMAKFNLHNRWMDSINVIVSCSLKLLLEKMMRWQLKMKSEVIFDRKRQTKFPTDAWPRNHNTFISWFVSSHVFVQFWLKSI